MKGRDKGCERERNRRRNDNVFEVKAREGKRLRLAHRRENKRREVEGRGRDRTVEGKRKGQDR